MNTSITTYSPSTLTATIFGALFRFTFSGKERDEETGYSYFGARYYDAELTTTWLSVDPMADKYPNISPYAYCAWNPVKLVDPDGMDTVLTINLNNGNTNYWSDSDTHNGTFVTITDDNDKELKSIHCKGTISTIYNEATTIQFSDNEDASDVFRYLTGESADSYRESGVEWDYYDLTSGSGDLVTSQKEDAVSVANTRIQYTKSNVDYFHHYHPNLKGHMPHVPSKSDQIYALELGVPSYLHFKGQVYRFDDIVSRYGTMSVSDFEKFIPLNILK